MNICFGEHMDTIIAGASLLVTFFIGFITGKQNKKMVLLEERNYLSSNLGSALITEIAIKGIGSMACNFNIHDEQIVSTAGVLKDENALGYGSVKILCKLQPMDVLQHIALVKIQKALLIGSRDGNAQDSRIDASSIDTKYSRVAISKDFDRFEFTIIMTREEKDAFIASINTLYSKVVLEMELSLVTDKYVESNLKCRATLCEPDYDNNENVYSRFKTTDAEPPICFWNGASIKHKNDIVIKNVSEDK